MPSHLFLVLSSGHFLTGFQTNTLHVILFSTQAQICLAHLMLLHLIWSAVQIMQLLITQLCLVFSSGLQFIKFTNTAEFQKKYLLDFRLLLQCIGDLRSSDSNHHQHCCENSNVATAVFNAAMSYETINTDNTLKEPAASFMMF
jgi:hypothetical protein